MAPSESPSQGRNLGLSLTQCCWCYGEEEQRVGRMGKPGQGLVCESKGNSFHEGEEMENWS
jgi:hypothetical protein